MSEKKGVQAFPPHVLVDADVFFSYLVSDGMSSHSDRLLNGADQGLFKLHAASEIYDDIISALRSDHIETDVVVEFIKDLRKLPHDVLPTTLDIAAEAMTLYGRYGGPRRLHYFDAFHVATAKLHELPLVTSDHYVLGNSQRLGIAVRDLRKV